MTKAIGFALVKDGSISVNTVADNTRAAMVNALFCNYGEVPMNNWSDDRVRETFNLLASSDDRIATVEIRVVNTAS